MGKVSKTKKDGKLTPSEEWSPRVSKRKQSGGTAWRADWWERGALGKYMHRSTISNRTALVDWIEQERRARARDSALTRRADRRGDSIVTLANLSPKEKAALASAVASLRAVGGGADVLADAVRTYAKTHLTGARKKIWRIVGEHLRIVRQRRRPATYADRRRNLAPLVAEHGRKLAATFSSAMAEDWVWRQYGQHACRPPPRRSCAFEFARRRGYINSNPVTTVERVEPPPPG